MRIDCESSLAFGHIEILIMSRHTAGLSHICQHVVPVEKAFGYQNMIMSCKHQAIMIRHQKLGFRVEKVIKPAE